MTPNLTATELAARQAVCAAAHELSLSLPEELPKWKAIFKSFPFATKKSREKDRECLTITYDRSYNTFIVADHGGYLTSVESISTIESWLKDMPLGGVRELLSGKPRSKQHILKPVPYTGELNKKSRPGSKTAEELDEMLGELGL